MTNQPHRIYTFDLLRGLAVLTMMLAHSVYFFHNRESDFLVSVEGFGNTVSFVTFLLVSGAVASVAYLSNHASGGQIKRKRVLTRVLLLLLAYYLLAHILMAAELWKAEGFARLRLVFDILSFRHLPGFTEYFPPFIFYSALLAIMPGWFLRASRTLKRVTFISVVALAAGWALYQLPVDAYLQPWVALVWGAEGLYRFPLLHYLPVFLIGLYWGHHTFQHQDLRAKRRLALRLGWFFAAIAVAAWLGSYFLDIPNQTVFSRWPPSVPFLSLGLAFTFLTAWLLYALRQLQPVRLLRDLLLLFGQNALGLFWSHIFLLSLYASADAPQVSSLAIFLFLWLLLVILSLALTTFLPFNFRLALTSARGSREEYEEAISQDSVFRLSKDVAAEAAQTTRGLRNYFFPSRQTTSRRVLKKRHKLAITLIVFAAASIIFPATIEELALQRQQQGASIWWGDDYAYRQSVTLQNTAAFATLSTGTPVAMRFNHKKLVAEGKSQADGRDMKLVYWTGDEHLVADGRVENPNTDQATLKFRTPAQIQAGKQEQFYALYYGGFIETPASTSKLETKATVRATFGEEQVFPLAARVSKRWSLIGDPVGETVIFHVTAQSRNETQTMTYEILNTPLAGAMTSSADTSWEASIPVSTLQPGAYRIQATLHDGVREQTSQITGFYRSHPLYVAWTQDWEGYDVKPAYLDAMEAIANDYQLPITHFFNPRVYITPTISPQRAQALTKWIQRRLPLGDAYGLHLHMFTDFVEKAGVEPKTEPNWGDNGSGYGVPMTAYTEAEQEKMIQYALDLMVANKFGRTDLFRAGGWFNNLDTLAALEDLGFQADSSARTAYHFGRNRLQGNWDILHTTPPYYPSRTNQNRSSGTNDFRVLEIPNNGADSYAFSGPQMIARFTANLGRGILDDKQQLTYLSHPHWFDEKEQARVRELFTFINQYTFSQDRGPVIFTTTKAIANLWTNDE